MKNIRWVDWRGDLSSPFPSEFVPRELCCLTLNGISQKHIWKGYKHLPNLKIMEIVDMKNLIMTPHFNGLPNLEIFILHECQCLKEIHPSIIRLERLVFVSIKNCPSLKIFPPLSGLKKLQTLTLSNCPKLVKVLQIPQNMDNLHNSGKKIASYKKPSTKFWLRVGRATQKLRNHKKQDLIDVECSLPKPCFPHNNMNHHIRKLDLSHCNVGDKDMNSAVWDLSYLEELNLKGNMSSRLSFSHLRLPRLKWLNVSHCKRLLEVSEFPSSIVVINAYYCRSIETVGDISNCRWLWKVSLLGNDKLVGDILLDSILQGNSLEDWFFSVAFEGHVIPKVFVGRLFRRNTFVFHLPNDWYNDFCGLLICFVPVAYSPDVYPPYICINIKQEVDEDSQSEICEESNEAPGLEFDEIEAFIGYVSFSLLRRTTVFVVDVCKNMPKDLNKLE